MYANILHIKIIHTSIGKLYHRFHRLGAADEKARSPNVFLSFPKNKSSAKQRRSENKARHIIAFR